MKKTKSYIYLLIIIVAGLVIDLVSKEIFANVFSGEKDVIVVIPNLLEFTFLKNTGAAFGMLSDKIWLLIIVSIVFLGLFVLFDVYNHSTSRWYIWGIGLIVSGAIGNFVDRIFLGYVRDFVKIEFFSFVFNIADMWITFGVICFCIYLLFYMKKIKKKEKGKDTKDAVEDK